MSSQSFPAEEILYEVWQGNVAVALADTLADVKHYLRAYQQDGPAQIVVAITKRLVLDAMKGDAP